MIQNDKILNQLHDLLNTVEELPDPLLMGQEEVTNWVQKLRQSKQLLAKLQRRLGSKFKPYNDRRVSFLKKNPSTSTKSRQILQEENNSLREENAALRKMLKEDNTSLSKDSISAEK